MTSTPFVYDQLVSPIYDQLVSETVDPTWISSSIRLSIILNNINHTLHRLGVGAVS